MYGVGSSEATSRGMNSLMFSSTFKQSSEGEFAKNGELMSSDLYHHHHNQQQQQQQQQSTGLMRYRSAPSSFFASLIDGSGNGNGNGGEDYLDPQSSSAESETIIARFASESDAHDLSFQTTMKHEKVDSVPKQNEYSPSPADSSMIYTTCSPAHDLPIHNSGGMESPFRVMSSMTMENLNQLKSSSGNCSNLIRQRSSPAGFFPDNEHGFAAMREVENFKASNRTNVESTSSTSRFSNHMNFSSGPSSCSRFMSHIAENGNESVGTGSCENGHLRNGNDTDRCYLPSIPSDSWNDSTFTSLKRNRDGDLKMFSSLNALDTENGDSRNYTPGLVHHLSLPKTSAEMAAVENFLHFQQDSVPCKIRAKRGFATHPRSIAERVRRTRISERMRKLQELFPNMDKQTNTADMLDLAVEYIKDLQKEVQTLKETRERCICSNIKKQSSPSV